MDLKRTSNHLFAEVLDRVRAANAELIATGFLPAGTDQSRVLVEPPREASYGDMATNAAMVLAKGAGRKPREIAEAIAEKLRPDALLARVDIAGPGFINLTLTNQAWTEELRSVLASGDDYGRSDIGAGETVNVEYVSANPTGPMHVGHGRGAVFGDALGTLLEFAGYRVTREFYVNDAGAQVDALARSAYLRYREALGDDIGAIPEGLYPGDYLEPVGAALAAEHGRGLIDRGRLPPPKGQLPEDWEDREQVLFRSTAFGDDIDRPLMKSDGSYTYFASDLAYHKSKFDRGFRTMIDVWGADHGGYVKRMQAAVKAVTGGTADLDIKIVQLVRLLRGGQPVKMSKRAGEFVTLREVVDEVGSDAVRFMMLYRKNDAVLDFDLAKVIEQSRDNPVFYVQYGHARGNSVFRNAREVVPELPAGSAERRNLLARASLVRLEDAAELAILKRIALYPR